jgi:hypothetical protein
VDPDDLPLGRIDAHFVAPPHTVASLKRCISNAERFTYFDCDKLFIDISSDSPMDDELSVSILTNEGPGTTPEDSMALVRLCFHQKVKAKCERSELGVDYV